MEKIKEIRQGSLFFESFPLPRNEDSFIAAIAGCSHPVEKVVVTDNGGFVDCSMESYSGTYTLERYENERRRGMEADVVSFSFADCPVLVQLRYESGEVRAVSGVEGFDLEGFLAGKRFDGVPGVGAGQIFVGTLAEIGKPDLPAAAEGPLAVFEHKVPRFTDTALLLTCTHRGERRDVAALRKGTAYLYSTPPISDASLEIVGERKSFSRGYVTPVPVSELTEVTSCQLYAGYKGGTFKVLRTVEIMGQAFVLSAGALEETEAKALGFKFDGRENDRVLTRYAGRLDTLYVRRRLLTPEELGD